LYSEEQQKRKQLLELLNKYDFINVIGNEPTRKYVGIVSCTIDGISSDTSGQLFSERNIAVRTGLHCAPLAHRFLGTFPSGTIRFSVNHSTNANDFAALEAALDDIDDNL
jgi:selenocysteine lyase/cysteine desulfurase